MRVPWGKLALGALLIVIVPIGIAIFLRLLHDSKPSRRNAVEHADGLGILNWSDTTFPIVTIPFAIVVGVLGVIHRDDLRNW